MVNRRTAQPVVLLPSNSNFKPEISNFKSRPGKQLLSSGHLRGKIQTRCSAVLYQSYPVPRATSYGVIASLVTIDTNPVDALFVASVPATGEGIELCIDYGVSVCV